MIQFSSIDVDFELLEPSEVARWLSAQAAQEERFVGSIHYLFCSDSYLLEKNQEYLDHDTYTDIITFDYCEGDVLNGEIFISIDRVRDNAADVAVDFETELSRVLAHGMLHLCGYGDKTDEEAALMRSKEEEWMGER